MITSLPAAIMTILNSDAFSTAEHELEKLLKGFRAQGGLFTEVYGVSIMIERR